MPVQADDRRGRALAALGQEQEAGHDLVHAVVEPEPLQGVAVVLLAGDDLDLRRVRPRRHLAQELDQDLAGPGAVDLLPAFQVGGHGPVGQRHVAEGLGHLGPRLALGLPAFGRLRPGPDLGRRRARPTPRGRGARSRRVTGTWDLPPSDGTGHVAIRARRWPVDRGADRPDNPHHEDSGTARPLHGARARIGRHFATRLLVPPMSDEEEHLSPPIRPARRVNRREALGTLAACLAGGPVAAAASRPRSGWRPSRPTSPRRWGTP